MLQDIIYSISSWIPGGGGQMADQGTLPLICSAAGALILSKFTGNVGMLTVPLNFSALFIGGWLASAAAKQLNIQADHVLELPLIATLAGMTIAALIMMMWMKQDNARG